MQKHLFLGACVAALALAGCAVPEASDEPVHARPDTVTGSNIPRKAPRAEAPAAESTPRAASGSTH